MCLPPLGAACKWVMGVDAGSCGDAGSLGHPGRMGHGGVDSGMDSGVDRWILG